MRAFFFLAMFSGLIVGGPLATSPTATAQWGTTTVTVVSGTVSDAASGAPLVGAQIHVEGLTLSALARNDGRYRLTIPASAGSEVVLRADLIGYTSLTKRVSLGAQSLSLDFALQSAGIRQRKATSKTWIDLNKIRPLRAIPNALKGLAPDRARELGRQIQ